MKKSMNQALIVAAEKTINGQESLQRCHAIQQRIEKLGIKIRKLTIDPLSTDWHSPLATDHFRSGCAPIEAISQAKQLIEAGHHPAVLIAGDEPLISGYSKEERQRLMAIYGDQYPITIAYDDLAHLFLKQTSISELQFGQYAYSLFNNYLRTYQQRLTQEHDLYPLPDSRWYNKITSLFRGVDCANPLVDFSGRVLICSEELVNKLTLPKASCVAIEGVGLGFVNGDGKEYAEEIVKYEHLKSAYQQCCEQANEDFTLRFLQKDALLEVYTCYPLVPLAFLQATQLVPDLAGLASFLEQYEITVTGGMNLARAPWNNPALNGLIRMYQCLTEQPQQWGLIHGNGGLGYRQGVVLLQQWHN